MKHSHDFFHDNFVLLEMTSFGIFENPILRKLSVKKKICDNCISSSFANKLTISESHFCNIDKMQTFTHSFSLSYLSLLHTHSHTHTHTLCLSVSLFSLPLLSTFIVSLPKELICKQINKMTICNASEI